MLIARDVLCFYCGKTLRLAIDLTPVLGTIEPARERVPDVPLEGARPPGYPPLPKPLPPPPPMPEPEGRDVNPASTVRVAADIEALRASLQSLTQSVERFPEVGRFWLDRREPLTQVRRVDRRDGAAVDAGHLTLVVEPSDFLRGFLAALRARDGHGLIAE